MFPVTTNENLKKLIFILDNLQHLLHRFRGIIVFSLRKIDASVCVSAGIVFTSSSISLAFTLLLSDRNLPRAPLI